MDMEFTLIEQWTTGETAEQDFERGLFEVARDWMSQSKFKKLPGPSGKANRCCSVETV